MKNKQLFLGRTDIPDKYAKKGVKAKTAGDLKKVLKELPDDLELNDELIVRVYTVNDSYLAVFLDDAWMDGSGDE